jgi:hypothetical protein
MPSFEAQLARARVAEFFLADVQPGLGPFVAAYPAASSWAPNRVGYALTFGGLVTFALQTPAGAAINAVRRKRLLLFAALSVLVRRLSAEIATAGVALLYVAVPETLKR